MTAVRNPNPTNVVRLNGSWSGRIRVVVAEVNRFEVVGGQTRGPRFWTVTESALDCIVGQGDSGGPVVTWLTASDTVRAAGTIVAGRGPCLSCPGIPLDRLCFHEAFSTNIDEIEQALGATVRRAS